MVKEVNRYTSNEFHEWQRDNLPSRFVLQDVDTWALVWADSGNKSEPFALVELKRSIYYEPARWTPFPADAPNYMALFKLSQRSNLPLWIIYFKKGEPITDASLFHVFNVTNVNIGGTPWITYNDKVITAKEFKDNFPNIF